jgi:hypothetical protein
MRKFKPLCILNEDQNFAGININDLMYISVICLSFVYPAIFMNKLFYTLPFVVLIFLVVAAIRQNHRRHFIRDAINYFSSERVVNVTDYNRKNRDR